MEHMVEDEASICFCDSVKQHIAYDTQHMRLQMSLGDVYEWISKRLCGWEMEWTAWVNVCLFLITFPDSKLSAWVALLSWCLGKSLCPWLVFFESHWIECNSIPISFPACSNVWMENSSSCHFLKWRWNTYWKLCIHRGPQSPICAGD